MKRARTVWMTTLLLVLFAVTATAAQQSEPERLLKERAFVVEKLSQPQSELVRASLLSRLKGMDKRLRELGLEPPATPEGSARLADGNTASQSAPQPEQGPEEPLPAEANSAPSSGDLYGTQRPGGLPEPPVPGTSRNQFRFSVSPWFRSNYFQTGADSPRESVVGTELSADFRVPLVRSEDRSLTAGVGVSRNLVRGVDDADWSRFEAALLYAVRAHAFGARAYYIPRRLTFDPTGGEPGFGRTFGAGAEYDVRLSRRTRTRLLYRLAQVRYEDFAQLDLTAHRVGGEIRHRFHDLLIPGAGLEWTHAGARSANSTYKEIAPIVMYGARVGRRVNTNLRYRYRLRDYPVADPTASNFDRRDRRHDISMYASVWLSPQWELVFFGGYLRNLSSRASRTFTDGSGGLTLRFRFPAEQQERMLHE